MKLLTAVSLALLSSCATLGLEDERAPFETNGNLETIVILGTNDIHGALAPEKMKTKDATPIEYEKGGATYFASQVGILRKQYGEHLLLLDAGDEFQGSIDSNLEEGRPMVRFFNELGYTAAVIGNHEFDFGPSKTDADLRGTLNERIREATYPYLGANIYDKKTGTFPGVPGTKASILVRAGRLKIGIVGLTTLDTPTSTRPEYAKGLEFREMSKVALEETKKLREDGADLVVLITHAGVFCNIPVAADRAGRTGMIKSESDFQTGCESQHEVPKLLRKLPKGTFDAVVSGHTHSLVHHWIEGVPVIQGGTRNAYYNLIYLTYDWNQKKLRTDKTRIEGPMPICPKVFANQKNCNGDAPAPPNGRGNLVTPKLRGTEVQENASMDAVLRPTFLSTESKKKEVVAIAAKGIPHTREQESPLGNLVADALRDSVQADFGLMNPGGIRADWQSGEIHFSDVFRTLPFDNYVSKLTLTGKELRRLIRITHSGARGFFSTSGLKVRAIRREEEPYSSDLDSNGKIEPWELDRLIAVTLPDGSPIEDTKQYTLATIDFLVSGGDSLGWFMNGIPKERITQMAGPVMRDAVLAYLKKVNLNQPLVDPENPRLTLENRPIKASKRSRTKKRRQ